MNINNKIVWVLCFILTFNALIINVFGQKNREMLDPKINTFENGKRREKLYDQIINPDGTYKVTIDNFVRAETDNYFRIRTNDGCFGKLCHNKAAADVNHQSIIRTNRDTRYSYGIFDLTSPLTITIPKTDNERFISMMVIQEDSYIRVFYKPGNYNLTKDNVGSRFIHITVRILVDPNSEADNKIVDDLQSKLLVKQADIGKLEIPNWDQESLNKTRNLILALAKDIPNSRGCFGTQSEVTEMRQIFGTAGGYGGNPEKDAYYLNLNPPNNDGVTPYTLTLKDVPVDAFWSVSLYNEKGYYEVNKYNSYNVNSVNAKRESDGSAVIHFGGDPKNPNFLYIMKGWNYIIRLYRPRKAILDGSWQCPSLQEVK